MKKHSNDPIRLIYAVMLTWALLAAWFAVADLQISIRFADPESLWADWLAEHGQKPGKFVCIVGLFLLTVARRQRSWRKDLTAYLIILLSAVAIAATLKFRGPYLWMAACLIAPAQVFIYQRYPLSSEQWLLFAKVSVSLFLLILIFVNLGKDIWGRVRFRQLDATYSQFTPWYLPQGYNDYKSFPSGHAAFAWMLLPLLILFQDKQRVIKMIVATLIVVWALAVVVSRVKLGAHYASDVLFSSGVMIVSFLWFRSYFKRTAPASTRSTTSSEPGEAYESRP